MISKERAVSIAIKEGKNYKKELAGKVLLVIYRDHADNELKYIEIEFFPHHFQHLTGLRLTEREEGTGNTKIREHTAKEFFDRCVKPPYITPGEIEFVDSFTIDLKMMALPYITQLTKISRMTGEYDVTTKKDLNCDYILGGVNSCIGISKNTVNSKFFPRTCLKEDIRDITNYTSQIIAIFQKGVHDKGPYVRIRYAVKGTDLKEIAFPDNIKEKILLA